MLNALSICRSWLVCGLIWSATVLALSADTWAAGPSNLVTPDKKTLGTQIFGQKAPNSKFSRQALINPLLDQLAKAEDAQTAAVLADAVRKLWRRSGSPTVDVLMSQAVKAMGKKSSEKALKLLDAVVEISPEFAEGWNMRATVLYLTRSYDASIADIHKVLELEPRHFGALSGLGLIMRALGDKKAALRTFRRALKIHPFMKAPRRALKDLVPEVEGQGI